MTKFERLFVWAGGALFDFSLMATAYVYFVRWAVPAKGAPHAIAIDSALLAVFAFHHSLFARRSVKAHVARVLPERLLRSIFVWTASLLLLLVLVLWEPIAGDLYHVTGWRAYAHAVVQLSGLWLIARAVAAIDPLELAGIAPPGAADISSGLQIAGPYRWVRHPLYLGWIVALFGAAHMTADRLAFAVLTTIYLLIAIPWEERSLGRTFGDGYARYRHQVRWRVIPYVY
jgi:isoprenylcysteine carboxyl methyltransferase (ICMT) family protein YpbQ